jgi:hypothetical protein
MYGACDGGIRPPAARRHPPRRRHPLGDPPATDQDGRAWIAVDHESYAPGRLTVAPVGLSVEAPRVGYRAVLAAHRFRDEAIRTRLERRPERQRVARSRQAIEGPPALPLRCDGERPPVLSTVWLARRLARRETDDASIRLLASVAAFPLFWAIETSILGWAAGLNF